MHRIAHFRMLIFILTYVWCIIEISCNNESTKADINPPGAGRTTPNINVSNSSIMSSEVNSNKTKPVFLEGGSTVSVNSDKNNDSSTSKTSIQNDTLNEKIRLYDAQYGLNDTSPSTDRKPHKGRKGVDALKETSSEETPVEHSIQEDPKPTESGEKTTYATNVSPTTSTTISSAVNLTTNAILSNGKNSSQDNSNQSASVVNVTSNSTTSFNSRNETQNSTNTENKLNATELTQPPKPKPEFTRDDSDIDDNSYSLTNPENDYVIPIVATIFAAPLLIVLAMFLYKRSKEFWERRHYRRMDFLIDGMYND